MLNLKSLYFEIFIEKWLSIDVLSLSSLKCFSMTLAPKDAATRGANSPLVWSEKPIGQEYLFDKNHQCSYSVVYR